MRWKNLLKILPIILFGLLMSCAMLFCGGEVDLDAINIELKAAHADLDGLITLVKGDEKLEPMFTKMQRIVGRAQEALQEYIDSNGADAKNVTDAINLALKLSDHLVCELPLEDEDAKRIKLGLFAMQAVLRRVEMHLTDTG